MEELASRAQLSEGAVVCAIIDGFRGTTDAAAVLFPARTLKQLKTLIPRFSQMLDRNPVPRPAQQYKPKFQAGPPAAVANAAPSGGNQSATRCLSCNTVGHTTRSCPTGRRVTGACFRCGSVDHRVAACPLPAPAGRVAAVAADRPGPPTEEDVAAIADGIAVINQVSVSLPSNLTPEPIRNSDLLTLFDTGSPISLIRRSALPLTLSSNHPRDSGFSGLGSHRLQTYGEVPLTVTFGGQTHPLRVLIVPDNVLPYPLLLGRDFLNLFSLALTFCQAPGKENVLKLMSADSNKIYQIYSNCVSGGETREFLSTSDFSVGPVSPDVSNCESTVSIPDTVDHWGDLDTLMHLSALQEPSDPKIWGATPYPPLPSHLFCIREGLPGTSDLNICPDLNPFHHRAISDIINQNYLSTEHIKPVSHNYELKIRLSSDVPVRSCPRRLSYADRKTVQEITSDLLKAGHIRPSNSPYASPGSEELGGKENVCGLPSPE